MPILPKETRVRNLKLARSAADEPYPCTPETVRRAKLAALIERIENDICPICDPPQLLESATLQCPNPQCRFHRLPLMAS